MNMTSTTKSPSNKKQKADNSEVAVVLSDAQANAGAGSPFSDQALSGLPSNPQTLSSPSSVPSPEMQRLFDSCDAQRVGEIQNLKTQIELLQRQQALASRPAAIPPALPTPGVAPPAPSSVAPTSEFLEFFKTMEAARVKSAAEASAIQVAARKEDLKNMETLSKKLTKKDGADKHNLKQTAILLGTAEALSVLSEGHFYEYVPFD
jgi:hypothetical protein